MSDEDLWSIPAHLIEFCITDLRGFGVEASDGRIGTLQTGCTRPGNSYLIVAACPSLAATTAMLPAGLLVGVDEERGTISLDCSRTEVARAPRFESDRYQDGAYRAELVRHYARTHATATLGTGPANGRARTAPGRRRGAAVPPQTPW